MDSLQRKRLQQRLLIASTGLVLVVVLVVNTFRPSEEEREELEFTEAVLSHEPGKLPPAQRERMREQWNRLPAESRSRVFRAVASARLAEFRELSKGLSKEDRQKRVRKRLDEMRQHRAELSPEQRRELRERLSKNETKEIVTHVLEFYQDELSAQERAELDPLIHEWLYHMDSLVGRR